MPNNAPVTNPQTLPEVWTKDMMAEKTFWAIDRGMRITEGSAFTRKYSLYMKSDGRHTFELALYSSHAEQPPASRFSGGEQTATCIVY